MNDALAAQRAGLDPFAFAAIPEIRADVDAPDLAASLPGDHPPWQRDVVSISSRARAVMARIGPVVVRVLTYWDHRLRDVALGARRLGVDASGCYRLR